MVTVNVLQRTFRFKYGDNGGTCFSIDIDGKQYIAILSGYGGDVRGMESSLNRIFPGDYPEVPEGGSVWVLLSSKQETLNVQPGNARPYRDRRIYAFVDRSRIRTAARPRRGDEPEGQGGDRERPHTVSARRMWAASSASVIGPTTCATIRPRRSMKNVVGVFATP